MIFSILFLIFIVSSYTTVNYVNNNNNKNNNRGTCQVQGYILKEMRWRDERENEEKICACLPRLLYTHTNLYYIFNNWWRSSIIVKKNFFKLIIFFLSNFYYQQKNINWNSIDGVSIVYFYIWIDDLLLWQKRKEFFLLFLKCWIFFLCSFWHTMMSRRRCASRDEHLFYMNA